MSEAAISRPIPWFWWLALVLLPISAYLAIGTDGLIVLALPHLWIAFALIKTNGGVLRPAGLAGIALGIVGLGFMAATHGPAERRYLVAFVLFATLGAAVGAAVGMWRRGRRSR